MNNIGAPMPCWSWNCCFLLYAPGEDGGNPRLRIGLCMQYDEP